MAVRFFKKLEPANSPVLGNGSKCTFTTLNHFVGYFATDNQYVQDELVRLIGEHRYGLSEIPEAEFHAEYVEVKKKLAGKPLQKLWREEIAPRAFSSDTLTPSVPKPNAVAAAVEAQDQGALVAKAVPIATAVSDETVAVSSPAPTEFKPQPIKRSRARKKE